MTAFASSRPASPSVLALRFAIRELRGGLRGFYVFIACIALGVATIAGMGSLSRALNDGLASEGRAILGGDVEFAIIHREASDAERTFLDGTGTLSTVATTRAMARLPEGADQALVEIKAVDGLYPLFGGIELRSGRTLDTALAGGQMALVEEVLLGRLGLSLGDTFTLGDLSFTVADVIVTEPDRLSGGPDFGPRVMVSLPDLRATGLIQPGSLVTWRYRIRLAESANADGDVSAAIARAEAAFPDAGWRARSRDNAAPQLRRSVISFTQFLTLVGLTALIVGGVGVANAVRAFVDIKRPVIATFKAIGATGGMVFQLYLVQIAILAGIGTLIGVVGGAAIPPVAGYFLADLLPFSTATRVYPIALLTGVGYGFLTAFVFALWPLGRARDVPVSALYRDRVGGREGFPRKRYVGAIVLLLALLMGMAVGLSTMRLVAGLYVAAAAVSFAALFVVAWLIMGLARRLPRLPSAEARLALSNIHRPGALTPSVVLSLGLGLTLIVALAQIDGNLSRQLTSSLPERAPSFFFVDIQKNDLEAFEELIAAETQSGTLQTVPMLRGRIVSLQGTPARDFAAPAEYRWVLNGDRGITYAETVPENTTIVAGEWWPADYQGEPLVSFEADEAHGLGLDVGDFVQVNVLGRTIEARIANLKDADWSSLNINFVMLFSPNTFEGAPYTMLSTLTFPHNAAGNESDRDAAILRALAERFPAITAVRVKDALEAVNAILERVALAIRSASSITLAASILVLAGALAAGHRQRIYDAVIMKALGATRRRLLWSFFLEYAFLGLATAVFGVLAGALAAYAVVAFVMNLEFVFLGQAAFAAAFGALVLTVLLGIGGTWTVLGRKPATVLREF